MKAATLQDSPAPQFSARHFVEILGAIQDSQLVRRVDDNSQDTSFIFKHALVQDTTYASLLKQDRQQLHRAVGRALEEIFPDQKDALASRLAQHFDAAGDTAKAVEYYARAGDVARGVYANAEAIMHYTRALELAEAHGLDDAAQIESLYSGRGRTYELSGRYPEALENYRAMGVWGQQHNAPHIELVALLSRSILHVTFTPAYDPELGSRLAEQALALAREAGDRPAEARALWNLELLSSFGKPAPGQAIAYGEEGLSLARRLNLRELMAFILNDLFYPYLGERNTSEAEKTKSEALVLWQELGNQPMIADVLSSSVLLYFLRGAFDESLAMSAQSLELAQKIGNLWGQSYALIYVCYVHWDRGDPSTALAVMRSSIRLGEQAGFVTPEVVNRADMGWFLAQLGAYEEGLELVHHALKRAGHALDLFGQWATIANARILIRMGELADAHMVMIKSRFNVGPDAVIYSHPQVAATLALVRAEYALATADYAGAVDILQKLLNEIERREIWVYTAEALYLQARAIVAQGDIIHANILLERATAAAEAIGADWMLWQILTLRGQLAAQGETPAQAAEHYARADALFQAILGRTPEAYRATFKDTPVALALREAHAAL